MSLISFLLLTVAAPLSAQSAPLFDSHEPLEITLEGPLKKVTRQKGDNREELPFTLSLAGGGSLQVNVRTRGNFRRRECSFPPLRLNFTSDENTGTPFSSQDKLKLVTHCKSGRNYQTNTLQEYLAYRIFNLISEKSFQVRLLRVTYVDSQRRTSRRTARWAFVIEDAKALASRLNGQHVEPHHVSSKDLDPSHATRVALFQYLIANTDYSAIAALDGHSCCHNMKLIRTADTLYSVPYDFDMSGLVNAAYAGPNPVVKQGNIRKRMYRGYCTSPTILTDAIDDISLLRDEILALFATTPGLNRKQSQRDIAYVERFFDQLSAESAISRFERSCLDLRTPSD